MSLTLFSTKGGPLTNAEVDGNFTYLEGRNNATDAAKLDKTAVGQSVAPLVAGKVPLGNLPDSVVSGLSYKGTWNAATNTPNLTTVQASGSYYVVAVAGTFGGTPYAVGDWIISNGTAWQKFEPVEDAATVAQRVLSEATLRLNYADNRYRVYEGLAGMADKTFAEAQTFTRVGDATGITATGRLATVGANLPVLEGNRGGLRIRGADTNVLWWSEDFSNAWWQKDGATINSNAIVAPNGEITADKIVESATSGPHGVISASVAISSGVTYTASFFLEKGERVWALIFPTTGAINAGAWFNLETGEVGTRQANNVGATIEPVAYGLYRCSISWTSIAASTQMTVRSATADGISQYLGDGTSGIYVWGAQLNVGLLAPYIKTEGAQATRAADGCIRTMGAEYNQSEGALYCEFIAPDRDFGVVDYSFALTLGLNAQNTPRIAVFFNNGDIVAQIVGSTTANNRVPFAKGAKYKVAISYTKNGSISFINGGNKGNTTAVANIGTSPILRIGRQQSGGEAPFNSTLQNIAYTPRALSEAELIALTAP